MRINEITKPLREGGKAFQGVGAIHIDEVVPTLEKLASQLGMSEIADNPLGSTGKKEYSGDIDVALAMTSSTDRSMLMSRLREYLGYDNVRAIAQIITTKVPIENYDESKNAVQPRTGYVQVDFMFGDVEWMKGYYHSPTTEESKFKGVHRNLAITAITQVLDVKRSEEFDDFDRPIEMERWKYGSHGLIRVTRTSRKNARTGKWVKKQDDNVIGEPIKSISGIADVLFRGKVGVEGLNSLESIIDSVKKAYSSEDQEMIFKQIAANYKHIAGDWNYPDEVNKYL